MQLAKTESQVTLKVTDKDLYSTNPGTLAGRYLRHHWQPVGRARDIAAGRAYPVQVMGERITVYRGESGRVHALQAYCPHRATLLSTGWVEGEALRCRYHGWQFGEDGSCLEQPGKNDAITRAAHIRAYPAQDYLDLVFVYLGEGNPPPMRRFPDFERPGVLEASPLIERWPCNVFNRIDNACDIAHLIYTHRESTSRAPDFHWRLVPPSLASEETEYGTRTCEIRPGRPISYAHFHMPNVNQVRARGVLEGAPGEPPRPILGDRLFFRVPVDDEHCVSYVVDHYALTPEETARHAAGREQRQDQKLEFLHKTAESVLRGEARLEDLKPGLSTYQIFWMEDYIVQVGQQPAPEGRSEQLVRTDSGVALLRRIWRRELQALADGTPLKNWVTPSGLSGGAE